MFGFLYNRHNKEEIESLSDEDLDDELYGNNNILDTVEEAKEQSGQSILEKQFEDEVYTEMTELFIEKQKRNYERK